MKHKRRKKTERILTDHAEMRGHTRYAGRFDERTAHKLLYKIERTNDAQIESGDPQGQAIWRVRLKGEEYRFVLDWPTRKIITALPLEPWRE